MSTNGPFRLFSKSCHFSHTWCFEKSFLHRKKKNSDGFIVHTDKISRVSGAIFTNSFVGAVWWWLLFHTYWDVSTKIMGTWLVRILNLANLQHERQNFTVMSVNKCIEEQERRKEKNNYDERAHWRLRHLIAVAQKKNCALWRKHHFWKTRR